MITVNYLSRRLSVLFSIAFLSFLVLFTACENPISQSNNAGNGTESSRAITGITVYTSGFTHIYWWNSTPVNSPANKPWAGVPMTLDPVSGLMMYNFPNSTAINLIFSNNGANQTPDLTRTTGSWKYSGGTWTTYNPNPTATASPGTTTFTTASLNVTLSATNPASGTYKIDNGIAKPYASNLIIPINGADLSVGQFHTLTLTNGSASNIYTYTKAAAPPVGITVYTSEYTHIYWWSSVPANSPANATWPGEAMAIDPVSGLKIKSFPNATSINLIFSNKGNNQTPDLSRTTGSWKYSGGVWSPYTPVSTPSATASPEGVSFTSTINITLNAANPSSGTYKWDSGTATTYNDGKVLTEGATWTVGQSKILTVANGTASNSYTFKKILVSHRDFREERVYFMMTDRFSDGNLNNNNIWGDEYLPGGPSTQYQYDENKTGILSYYHGGDFAGIIKNLDYIQDMGFSAIWITPVVKQPEGRRINNDNNYSASAFHGYWGYDFDKIDPHLGDSGNGSDNWADFDKLVKALHDRGMKLMLDIVVNHGQPGDSVKGSVSKWANKWNQIIMNGQTWTYDKATDPLVVASNPLTGMFSYPGTGGSWLIDLIDFNGNGPAANSAMPHLKAVYKKFIDHGVDAFRIDTVAYMSHNNWVDFTDAMAAHAKSLGNDHFYMIGEAWTGDRGGSNNAVDIIYGSKGTNFHMLDLHNSSMDFPGWLSGVFKGDKGFEDTQVAKIYGPQGDQSGIYDPTYLGTFVDNHDVYRANGVLTQTQYMNNLSYIYLFRGVPIVYYGTEAMYSWSGAIATTNKEDVCARWMLGDEGINYVKTNKPLMYQHIKMLNKIRGDFPVLQKGQQTNLVMSGDKAVVKRVYGTKNGFIALSKGAAYTDTQTVPNGTYTLVNPNSAAGTYSSQTVNITTGTYNFTVPGNSFVLLLQ